MLEEEDLSQSSRFEEVNLEGDAWNDHSERGREGEDPAEVVISLPPPLMEQREDPPDSRLASFFDHPPIENYQSIVDNRNAKFIAEELFPSKTNSRDVGDVSPARGTSFRQFFPKNNDNLQISKIYSHGDIVWAQADPHFPFWPAVVIDFDRLPVEIQNNLQGLKPKTGTPRRKQKLPLYFYGRNDYDLVSADLLHDFESDAEQYKRQEVDSSLHSAFLIGLSLAEEEILRPVAERISWLSPESPLPDENDEPVLLSPPPKSRSLDRTVKEDAIPLNEFEDKVANPELQNRPDHGEAFLDDVLSTKELNAPVDQFQSLIPEINNEKLTKSSAISPVPEATGSSPIPLSPPPTHAVLEKREVTEIFPSSSTQSRDPFERATAEKKDVVDLFSSNSSTANPFDGPSDSIPPQKTKAISTDQVQSFLSTVKVEEQLTESSNISPVPEVTAALAIPPSAPLAPAVSDKREVSDLFPTSSTQSRDPFESATVEKKDVVDLFSSNSSTANLFDAPSIPPQKTKANAATRGPFDATETLNVVPPIKVKAKTVYVGLFDNVPSAASDPFSSSSSSVTVSKTEITVARAKKSVPVSAGLFDNVPVADDPFSTVQAPSAPVAPSIPSRSITVSAQSTGLKTTVAAAPTATAKDVFSSNSLPSAEPVTSKVTAGPAATTAKDLFARPVDTLLPSSAAVNVPQTSQAASVNELFSSAKPLGTAVGALPEVANDSFYPVPHTKSTDSVSSTSSMELSSQHRQQELSTFSQSFDASNVFATASKLQPTDAKESSALTSTRSHEEPSNSQAVERTSSKSSIKGFKGKAQVVSGASPFDQRTSSGSSLFPSTDLFPSVANDPFASIPAPAAVQTKPSYDASSVFNNTNPVGVPVAGSKVTNKNSDLFSQPSPASRTVNSKVISAADVFNKMGPPSSQQLFDNLPPTAPGVKKIPVASPPPPSSSSSTAAIPSETTVTGEDFSAPKVVSSATSKNKQQKPKAHFNNAGIPTPHGFVSLPATATATATPPTQQPFDNKPPVSSTPITKVKQPIVNPQILTSLVEVVPEPIPSLEVPPPADPSTQRNVEPQAAPQSEVKSNVLNYRGGRYVKPAGVICTFGFGGKCLTMFPDVNICPPVYTSASQIADERRLRLLPIGRRPSVLKVHKLLNLFGNRLPTYEHIPGLPEMLQFKKLLISFSSSTSGPEDRSKAKTGPPSTSPVNFADTVLEYIQQPITSFLSQEWLEKSYSGLKREEIIENEQLLWSLLTILLKHNGKLSSPDGITNPHSPEREIVDLLLKIRRDAAGIPIGMNLLPDSTNPLYVSKLASLSSDQRNQYYNRLQSLLIQGNRDEALEFSIEQHDWTTAMMLASITGPEKYQEVIRCYSQAMFLPGHPLHLLMMVYSNQANKTLVQSGSKTLPKFIHSVNADPAKQTVTQQEERLFKSWQISLASILSNKTADWEQLVQLLGYRLQQDYKNLFGAHLVYLCANSLPSDPRERVIPLPTLNTDSLTGELDFAKLRDFPLLGSSFADKLARVMADCVSIMSLRMTEVLEYSLEKALNSSSDPAAANNSGISDSKSGGASGFFGWIGGASGKTSDKRQVEELSKDKKELADKLLRLRVILCPFKVRFALQLADYGLNSAAATYIQQSLSLVKEVASLDDPKNANRRPSVPILPFAKKFIEALEDIADRFGVKSKGYNVTVTGSAPPSNSIPSQSSEDIKSSSSGWGISSVLSAANLKDFVDGPQQPPNGSAPRPNGTGGDNARTARGPPPQISHSPYPQGNTAPPQTLNHNPFPQGAGVAPAPHTRQTFNNTSSPAYPGGTNSNRGGPPLNSPGAYAAQSAPHLAASNNPPPTANFPAVAPASNSSVNSSGFVEVTLEDTGVNASYATAATPPSHIYSYPGSVTQAAANTNSSNTSAVSAPSNRASGRGRPHHHPAGVQQTFPSNKVVSSPWAMNAVSTGMQPQENANNSSSNTPPVSYHPSNPGQQSNNSNNNNNNNNSHFPTLAPASGPPSSSSQISNPAGDNNAPSKAERPQSGPKGLPPSPNSGSNLISVPTTGLVSTFRKGIINWFYPDAHDATENIGKSLEAYFDEKLNRWVFPGEDNPVADAALKPPPTGPLGGQPAAAIPSNDVQRLPDTAALNGGASSIAVAAAGGGYDPLAALMAPPTRAVRPPTSTSSVSSSSSIPADDPIAQMMMPPRFSSSLNNSNIPSANSTPPTSSAGAPPPSSQSVPTPATTGSGPPSKFNVWKPKPTENLAYASNPDMNQLMNQYQSQLPPVTSNNPGIAAISTTTADPDPGNADTAGSAGNPAAALTEIPLDGNNASQGPPPTFPTVSSSSSSSYIPPYAVNQSNVAYSYNDDAYNNFG